MLMKCWSTYGFCFSVRIMYEDCCLWQISILSGITEWIWYLWWLCHLRLMCYCCHTALPVSAPPKLPRHAYGNQGWHYPHLLMFSVQVEEERDGLQKKIMQMESDLDQVQESYQEATTQLEEAEKAKTQVSWRWVIPAWHIHMWSYPPLYPLLLVRRARGNWQRHCETFCSDLCSNNIAEMHVISPLFMSKLSLFSPCACFIAS